MPYYLDNITETIKLIKNKIPNKKDLFYVFPNDIENIMSFNKIKTKEECITKLIKLDNDKIDIKVFDTSNSNMILFVNDYYEFIKDLKTVCFIQTPLINVSNIQYENYFVDNYLPFIITKFTPKDNDEVNETQILLYREDYFKELFLLYDYINKNNFFGETYNFYNERYNNIIQNFI